MHRQRSDSARYSPAVTFVPLFAPHETRTPTGLVHVEHAAPGVLCCRVTGNGDGDAARAILEASDLVFGQRGAIHTFHDWLGVTGYTSEARTLLTEWSRPRRHAIRSTLLFEGRILAMGVAVAAMAIPGVNSHANPAAFHAERRAAIAAALGAAA